MAEPGGRKQKDFSPCGFKIDMLRPLSPPPPHHFCAITTDKKVDDRLLITHKRTTSTTSRRTWGDYHYSGQPTAQLSLNALRIFFFGSVPTLLVVFVIIVLD
jgi:hypothetical protein